MWERSTQAEAKWSVYSLCDMAKVILDAGHGGMEPGAIYEGRREKDDNLRLALEVGDILRRNGVEVAFTRTEDVYNTPFEKAQIANREGGDFLVSFHRNSSPQANQYSGVETLVFDRSGKKVELAENINRELEQAGFRDLGVKERPGLVILRRSRMPAVLIETGFINTDADNELFDAEFDEIAQAIADGILQTLSAGESQGRAMESMESGMGGGVPDEMADGRGREADGCGWRCRPGNQETDPAREKLYRVQTGAFRRREYADELLYQLQQQSYPAFLLHEDGLFKVQVGAFRYLDNAVRMEAALRRAGYSTFITT